MTFSKIAIVGPGLIGGSIALELRSRFPEIEVAIWARRQETIDQVAPLVTLASTELQHVVSGADLVVLCTPVEAMPALAQRIVDWITPETLVTDVGSVKNTVVQTLTPVFRKRARFIGSHPMAGAEQTGFSAARLELFTGSVCIVTPEADTSPADVRAVSHFWQGLGCQVRSLSPEEHDKVVALISHLPHLLAASLVNLVDSQNSQAFEFCGPGFRDTSRVASGDPTMWTGIFTANRAALANCTKAMIEKLQQIERLIDQPDQIHKFLKTAKTKRDQIRLHK